MITLDLFHLFKIDPQSNKIPRKVRDWVLEREEKFPIQYQISFWPYRSEKEKQEKISYDIIFGTSIFDLRTVIFPLNNGEWVVRLIGAQLEDGAFVPFLDPDNPKHENIRAFNGPLVSGMLELMQKKDPLLETEERKDEHGCNNTWRKYKRTKKINASEEEMVSIDYDRNVNDEWRFRGTGEEFKKELKISLKRSAKANSN